LNSLCYSEFLSVILSETKNLINTVEILHGACPEFIEGFRMTVVGKEIFYGACPEDIRLSSAEVFIEGFRMTVKETLQGFCPERG